MRKPFYTIFIIISCFLWIGANTYDVQWQELENAFTYFLSDPSKTNADAVVAFLPSGERASHHYESFDGKAAERIYQKTGDISELINNGNDGAYRVAFALTEISDGEWATWLGAIIGDGITQFPETYLQEVLSRHWSRRYPCIEAVQLHWDFQGDHIAVLKARLDAIKTVNNATLEAPKKCAIALIEEYLDKPPFM